jgi:acyl-CoA thioester hydrolase
MSERGEPRAAYRHLVAVPTRWADNDVYGHVNNVAYYGYFDTAVNRLLIERCGLDIHGGPVIGLVVETGCRYHAPVAFPDALEVGIAVERLGRTSVAYALGVFRAKEERSVADGRFVHVYVDRASRRPVPLPDAMRSALAPLQRGPS